MSNLNTVLFVGGGTLGSVTPLLNVWQVMSTRTDNWQAVWIGTISGPEVEQIKKYEIDYYSIKSGKFRRYFSFKTFLDPFLIITGFFESLSLLKKIKPKVIVGAGSFIQVPVCLAAKILKIPIILYQMDVRPGLANSICSRFAETIAVAMPGIKYPWPEEKQILIGAVAPRLKNNVTGNKILIFGGGTGARFINETVVELVTLMPADWEVIHLCGHGKLNKKLINKDNYQQLESVVNEEMLSLLAQAKIVVGRAGMGGLFEIGGLGKQSIIIPIPNSHQEDNAIYYANKGAIILLDQNNLDAKTLIVEIAKIIAGDYPDLQKNIATITSYDGAEKLLALILKINK